MPYKRYTEGNIVTFEHEKLSMSGLLGVFLTQFDKIPEVYKNHSLECSPVLNEPPRAYVAAFSFKPPIDIIISEHMLNREASIVAYSLDGEIAKTIIRDIAKQCNMTETAPSDAFLSDLEIEFNGIVVP